MRSLPALVAALGLVSGCLVDTDDRCGAHSSIGPVGTCLCDDGFAADEDGVCREQKANPEALGVSCDEDSPCEDPKYSLCQPVDAAAGYCTNADCESHADCDGDYFCDTRAEPSYCRRPPTGQGEPCTSAADCEGFEADYCLVNPVKSACLVADCDTDADCQPGWTCEDYSGALPGTPKVCVTNM